MGCALEHDLVDLLRDRGIGVAEREAVHTLVDYLTSWQRNLVPAVHFVGFRGEEYWSAVRIWGRPGFIHRLNDLRMLRELHPSDIVVYANGHDLRTSERNGNDLDERLPA